LVKLKKIILIISGIVFLMLNCEDFNLGNDLEDPISPSPPEFIPQSLPADTIQTGIGPAEYVRGIYLEWYSNTESDIGGYYIYRAENSTDSTFELLDTVEVYTNIFESNSYIDTLVNYYTYYFYFITAYDYGKNESAHSDTIRYMLTEKVDLVTPDGMMSEKIDYFIWYDFANLTNEYVIELESLYDNKNLWIARFYRPDFGDSEQKIKFNFDDQAKINTFEKKKIYRWRIHSIAIVDEHNRDICGSKSSWNYFSLE